MDTSVLARFDAMQPEHVVVIGRVHALEALHHQVWPFGSEPIEYVIDESTAAVRPRPAAPSHVRSRPLAWA